MNWATVFGVTHSCPWADKVAVSRVTRSGKGGHDSRPKRVRHAPEQPLATAAHQHDVVVLCKLVQDRLQRHDAPAGFRVETFDPRRSVFREPGEALFGQPIARRPAEQFLVVDMRVAETGRHGHADLGAAAPHFLGDRQNCHGILLPSTPSI